MSQGASCVLPRKARRSRLRRAASVGASLVVLGLGLGRALAEEDAAPSPVDPARSSADADADQKAFVERVAGAIDKGRDFLLRTQQDDGTWTMRLPSSPFTADAYGAQALALLSLAKTGVKASHPKMVRGLEVLDRMVAQLKSERPAGVEPGHRTYAAACVAMLLDALYVEHVPASMGEDGKMIPEKSKGQLPGKARKTLEDIVDFHVRTQRAKLWRYPSGTEEDLSASQYALMGLLTGGRLGIHCKPEVYRKALARLLEWQDKFGEVVPRWIENPTYQPGGRYPRYLKTGKAQARGWSYQGKSGATGAMTAAGLSCLAIIKDRLAASGTLTKDESKAIDRALTDGIAWLGSNFEVGKNPGGNATWHYYYLYGVERAASLMGIANFGDHDWYREGADYLVGRRARDGSWPKGPHGAETTSVETAFALLFLKRATVRTRVVEPPVTSDADEEPK
jgi:hypothetical protein